MPLQRRLPKVGFSSRVNNFSTEIKYDRLEKVTEDEITIELLKKYKLIKSKIKKVKVIGPCTIKIKKVLNFATERTIEDAVKDLKNAFDQGLLKDTLTNDSYFNIKKMNSINLK